MHWCTRKKRLTRRRICAVEGCGQVTVLLRSSKTIYCPMHECANDRCFDEIAFPMHYCMKHIPYRPHTQNMWNRRSINGELYSNGENKF